eukprot:m.14455 g.14455  ORF g.14455 m.14455 type:complete len:442 (-) comp8378_c0_seq1:50-1375(-)
MSETFTTSPCVCADLADTSDSGPCSAISRGYSHWRGLWKHKVEHELWDPLEWLEVALRVEAERPPKLGFVRLLAVGTLHPAVPRPHVHEPRRSDDREDKVLLSLADRLGDRTLVATALARRRHCGEWERVELGRGARVGTENASKISWPRLFPPWPEWMRRGVRDHPAALVAKATAVPGCQVVRRVSFPQRRRLAKVFGQLGPSVCHWSRNERGVHPGRVEVVGCELLDRHWAVRVHHVRRAIVVHEHVKVADRRLVVGRERWPRHLHHGPGDRERAGGRRGRGDSVPRRPGVRNVVVEENVELGRRVVDKVWSIQYPAARGRRALHGVANVVPRRVREVRTAPDRNVVVRAEPTSPCSPALTPLMRRVCAAPRAVRCCVQPEESIKPPNRSIVRINNLSGGGVSGVDVRDDNLSCLRGAMWTSCPHMHSYKCKDDHQCRS